MTLQGPIWLLGWSGSIDADTAVLIIAILRLGLGWALRDPVPFLTVIWLLARNATPIDPAARTEPEPA